MNHDRIATNSETAFEIQIKALLARPKMISRFMAEVPVVGGTYFPNIVCTHTNGETYTLGCREDLPGQVLRALVSRERFRLDWPHFPELPLHEDHIEAMKEDARPRYKLVGYFAESLAWGAVPRYDYEGHPSFVTFARGLMAYEHTPIEIRRDRELNAEFPPMALKGLCDGRMIWRNDGKIAEDRDEMRRHAEQLAELATV
jgi:hypothetical protein